MSSFYVRFILEIRFGLDKTVRALKIPFENIESATDNFADKNLIAQGSSGKFYRGQLLQSEKMIDVVVRVFKRTGDIYTEIMIFCKLKHENISPILYWAINDADNENRFFIHKIEANGSLAEHLCGSTLTWTQRLSICIGVGQALKYIHSSDFHKPGYYVIHGNINSSEIFLDDDWQPKLHGFESAMVAERKTLFVTNKYEGTLQYKDPAYEKTGALTDKSDVFSFGVVLFEVLFGRKAAAYTPNEEQADNWNFAEFARLHCENKTLDKMIDPDMKKNMDPKSIEIFSNVAYFCLTEQREQRPNMDEVVRELEESLELQKNHERSMVTETSSRHLQGKSFEHLQIPLKDILSATERFHPKYEIGSGGFATVYKAKLEHFESKNSSTIEGGDDGSDMSKVCSTVAIKLIPSTANRLGEKGFIAEVQMLSKFNHQNIVSLHGFCNEGLHKILIYEYVPNGSLDNYLERSYRRTNLTWGRRIQICLDIAHGLEYLHTSLPGKEIIIHRDIKSANILLDDNLRAKIADFGLSRLYTIHAKNSTIKTDNLAGTEMYLDPEYMKTGKLKKASDIYSFGVVLFEILCGKLAYDKIYTTNTEKGLPSIARRLFKEGKSKTIIDPSIMETDGSIFLQNRVADQHSLDTFLNMASQCLAETQNERPTIKEVIKELETALNFQKNNQDNLQVLLEDINLATQGFSDCNCIGVGKFWMLYKGEVPEAISNAKGCTAIVAKRWNKSGQGHQQFFGELEFVFKNKNEAVTKLVGYCTEMEEKIIVYEHSSKGTLDQHLKDVSLTWIDRLKICMDVVNGLDFFDSREGALMMHAADIKSGTILIDGKRKIQIANLELSRAVSKKSKGYALGVIFVEVLSGRLASEDPSKPLGPLAIDWWTRSEHELDEIVFEGIKDQIDPLSLREFIYVVNECFGNDKPSLDHLFERLSLALRRQKNNQDNLQVLFEDINLATQGFSDCNCIGVGKFWKLYKGEVPEAISNAKGCTAIVAKRWNKSGQGHQQFIGELEFVFKNKNEAVTKLVGYCTEMEEKIIVYEHSSKGTLDKHLKDVSLTWMERIKICMDVVKRLRFFDSREGALMMHAADIKSGNILIDGKRMIQIANLELSTAVSKKSIGYALGVIFVEVLSGRLASEDPSKPLGPLAIDWWTRSEHELDEMVFEGIKDQIDPLSLREFIYVVNECFGNDKPSLGDLSERLSSTLEFQEKFEACPQLSLEDIKLGTQNFSDDKCVAKGKHWKLYEGEFADANADGFTTALVKRWDNKSREAAYEFLAERSLLSQDTYPGNNIIGIEGYCHEMDENIIVYEHGYSRSLHKHLDDANFGWMKRLEICKDVAYLAFFLHTNGIGLGDIKSGSILIDSDWKVKVFILELSLKNLICQDSQTEFLVVLLEMLCGRLDRGEGCESYSESLKSLAQRHYKEKGNLDDLVFEGIKEKIAPESLNQFVRIVGDCLESPVRSLSDMAFKLERAWREQEYFEKSPQISLKDIKSATHDFSNEKCIGEGRYWKLYEGEFPHGNANGYTTALVKRWDSKSSQGRQQFFRELKIHYQFKENVNIVAVEGYCSEKNEKIIVFEHAYYRTLDKHLDNTCLSWTKRLNICINVASVLNFFHNRRWEPYLMHGDIKSGSILIDGDWNAKVSNFENLFAWDGESYVDPLLQRLGRYDNIYSLGVVLLEMMCGRLAWPEGCDDHSRSLGPLAQRHYKEKGNLDELVFESIKEQIAPESLTAYQEIALKCIADAGYRRPVAQEIVKQLKNALELQEYVEKSPQISLKDIKSATHDFSNEKCIGEGRYWKLYEGEFPHGNANGYTTALVKRWDSNSSQGRQQFFRELKIHYRFKENVNIVAVEGYCSEKNEKIIVFEHAYYRSLDKHLDDTSLSWTKRLNICINVASVLNFFHNPNIKWEPYLMHGDIKSGSILIDGDWNAKVSNFENFFAWDGEWVTESSRHQRLGKYKDIYSLGVVLLEMMCGRLAWPEGCDDHSRSLGPLAQRHYKEKGNLNELVFEGIKEQIAPESLTAYQEIALKCIADTEDWQPDVDAQEIVKQLKNALKFQEDYETWNAKLPKEYKEYIQMSKTPKAYSTKVKNDLYNMLTKGILLQQGKQLFTLGANGGRNEMISAMMFSYKNRSSRIWQSIPESRFQKVAQMLDISNLKIQIRIKTQFLSPGINYGVHLVFKFCQSRKSRTEREYVNLSYKRGKDNLHAYFATWRDDEWMMIELCRFSNDKKDVEFEAFLKSFSRCYCGSRIIYVDGIEFRSIDNVNCKEIEKSKVVQQVLKSYSNIDEVQQSTIECQEISKIFGNDEDGEKMFKVNEVSINEVNRKKYLRLSPMEFLYDSCNMKPFDLNPSSVSRSEKVEFLPQQVFGIKCKIESQMLSPDTDYMCYLVFKFSEKCNGLHGPVIIRDLLNWKNKEAGILYFRLPSPWNLHDTDSVPRARKDEWMEVTVWKFNSKSKLRNDSVPMNLKLITYDGTMSGLIVCNLEIRPI